MDKVRGGTLEEEMRDEGGSVEGVYQLEMCGGLYSWDLYSGRLDIGLYSGREDTEVVEGGRVWGEERGREWGEERGGGLVEGWMGGEGREVECKEGEVAPESSLS